MLSAFTIWILFCQENEAHLYKVVEKVVSSQYRQKFLSFTLVLWLALLKSPTTKSLIAGHIEKCSFLPIPATLQLIYEKLPKDIASRHVLLLDPVLATGWKCFAFRQSINSWITLSTNQWIVNYCPGNSAVKAISVLLSKGVPESNIIFLNLISVSNRIQQLQKSKPIVFCFR